MDEQTAREMAFRRGYHQAVAYLDQRLTDKLSPEGSEWMADYESKVSLWRATSGDPLEPPPGHFN